MSEPQVPAVVPSEDPVQAVQQALAQIDTDAMVIGYACVVEWLEPDGSTAMSVLHTPMPPWHMHGLLTYGRDYHCGGMAPVVVDVDADDEDF
jgi:hypothetical protein